MLGVVLPVVPTVPKKNASIACLGLFSGDAKGIRIYNKVDQGQPKPLTSTDHPQPQFLANETIDPQKKRNQKRPVVVLFERLRKLLSTRRYLVPRTYEDKSYLDVI